MTDHNRRKIAYDSIFRILNAMWRNLPPACCASADLEGGAGAGVRSAPPPLEFSKYTSQRTTFSELSGGIFYMHI